MPGLLVLTLHIAQYRLAMRHDNQPKQNIAAATQSFDTWHPVNALHIGTQTGSHSELYIQNPREASAVMNKPVNG